MPEAQAPEPVQKEIATVRKGPTSVPAEGLLEPDPLFHDGRDPGVPFLGCCTADSTEQDTPKGNRQRAREILVDEESFRLWTRCVEPALSDAPGSALN